MPTLEMAEGVVSLPRDEWNALVGSDSPFLEWEWLAALEESGCVGPETGWTARPLVVREGERLLAACPLYLKEHSEGEFVFDMGWADAAQRAGIQYYPKLLVGVPFTPVTGRRFLVPEDETGPALRSLLADSLREVCVDNDLSGVHVNFCLTDEIEALEKSRYLLRVGVQYHWHNADYDDFDAYLARFRSKRRNQIRRERRSLAEQGVRIEALAGDDIPDELFDPMYRFYLATIRSRYWGRQYLNPHFFERVREEFRSRLVFIVAYRGDEPIGGTFNVRKGDALYGRYWGTTHDVRYLHFNVCYYAAVEYCIEQGLSRFEPGAGGDYKQMRGFDAQPTHSAHFLADPRLSSAVERFLDSERGEAHAQIEWLRDASAFKKE